MRKIINLFLLSALIVVAVVGCGKGDKSQDVSEEFDDQLESDDYSETEDEMENKFDYQGSVDHIVYREKDRLFSVFDYYGNQIFIDLEGNVIEKPELISKYLQFDSENSEVIDMYNNDVTEQFVKDPEHEKVIGVCHMLERDVVWVKERNETPEHSQIVIKGFDEDGNELCRVDSDNSYFNQYDAENFQYIKSVAYAGDTVCRICYTRGYTEGLFSINVETGEILRNGEFSDGYTVLSGEGIQDVHGKYLVVKDDTLPEMLYNTCRYSDGMFFSKDTKKFYDINLNEKIDLSEYDLFFGTDNVFKDGYCGIEVMNDMGTRFYGIIDTDGNWIIELTDTLDHQWNQYIGKISENKILLGSGKVYNLLTKEFEEYPSLINDVRVDGKCYYVNDAGEICIYDIEKCVNQIL